MKLIHLVAPIVTVAAAAAAHAQSDAPGQLALGVAQAITHEGNVYRAPGGSQDDWRSTTTLEAHADQPLGSGRWRGHAWLRAHRYAEQHELDSNDHRAALALDFLAMPQLSGTVGGHTRRQRHHDGLDAPTFNFRNPIETEHAAHLQTRWGGPGDWAVLMGADALERSYTQPAVSESNHLRQRSLEVGVGWQPQPALGALTLRRTHIDRPLSLVGDGGDVERREVELRAQWQATPASRLRARLAHVQEDRQSLIDRSFWTGGVAWDWAPTGTLRMRAEVFRDTEGLAGPQDPFDADADARPVRAGDVRRHGLRWTTAWAVSATTRLLAAARHSARQLNEPLSSVHPKDRTTALSVELRHSPWRSLDLGCGLTHEKRHANWDSQAGGHSLPYEAASIGCQLAWWHR